MTRGGKRKGAGRPTKIDKEGKDPKVTLSCRVEPETKAFLEREKKSSQFSVGEIVDQAVSLYIATPSAHLKPR